MLGGDRELVREMEPDLLDLGFSDSLSSGEVSWSAVDPAETFAGLRDQRLAADAPDGNRVHLWQAINETMTPQAAIAFLLAVLGSRLERESAAAAAALWRQISSIDRRHVSPRFWRPYFWEWWNELEAMGLPEPDWWPLAGPMFDFPDIELDVSDFKGAEWEPDPWNFIYERTMSLRRGQYEVIGVINFLTLYRLNGALRSRDPIVRSLASAAFLPSVDSPPIGIPPPIPRSEAEAGTLVSTMIHGTRGYMGHWWQPEGDFFDFIRRPYRPNLYTGGARFDWSGKWSRQHRERAGQRFNEWARDDNVVPNGLQTVFAHSYGGEIAARAVNDGAPIKQLVLLSTPVTTHVETSAESGMPIVDIRLKRDPVLLLARIRDKLKQHIEDRANVTALTLKPWSLDHGASHKPDVWQAEKLVEKSGI